MNRTSSVVRSFLLVVSLLLLLAPAAQAQGDYVFIPRGDAECGNFTPINPELDLVARGDRHQVYLQFKITQEQIDAEDCAGSHFNLRFYLSGFDELVDWDGCFVDYEHEYSVDWDVADTGNGSAVATVYGAKFVEGRMYPGYVYWAEVNCPELWPDRHSDPSVSIEYIGTWWSTAVGKPGCEQTDFVTSGTKGPAGLPLCVYTGPSAQLVGWSGDTEFLFPQGRGV